MVLNHGIVEQIGTPDDIYERPASSFVAGFIGSPPMNLLPARVIAQNNGAALLLADGTRIETNGRHPGEIRGEMAVWCGIRPEDLIIAPSDTAGTGVLRGQVLAVEPLGPEALVTVATAGQDVAARIPAKPVRKAGEVVTLAVQSAKLHLFDQQSGRRL